MDERIERLKKWARGEPAPPFRFELHITNQCNLSCLSCWAWSTARPAENSLSGKRLHELIDEASALGVRHYWLVGGGEPMFNPDLCLSIQRRIKDHNGIGHIVTNGTRFTSERIEFLTKIGWDMIVISLDSSDAQINDYLRNKTGVYHQIITALRDIQAARIKYGVDKPTVRINTVISSLNIEILDALFELASEYHVREVLLLGMSILSPKCQMLKPSAEQVKRFEAAIPYLAQRAKELGVETNVERYHQQFLINSTEAMNAFILKSTGNTFFDSPCFDPWERLIVLPNGNAGSCNAFREQGLVDRGSLELQPEIADSVLDMSLSDIWYGKTMELVRTRFRNRQLLPICVRCCVGNILENQRIRKMLKGEKIDE